MNEITADELAAAAETLSKIGELAAGFHPEHALWSEAAQLRLFTTLMNVYLLDLVRQRLAGVEPLDALLVTLKGDTPVFSPEAQEEFERAQRQRLQ